MTAGVALAPSLLNRSRQRLISYRGLDVTSTKRRQLMLTAAVALTIASSFQGGVKAQIMFPFPPYRTAVHDSSVRLEVTPQQAEIFVDGYYAGVVDDFDGMLQRLRAEPGHHEITLYHEGYRTARQSVYLVRDRTFKIRLQMERLGPGEVAEARPVPALSPVGVQPSRPLPRDPRGLPPASGSVPPPNATPPTATTGRLTIQVQPADADLVIDGQPWPATPGQDTVVLDLSEGRHVIQVRKPGYVGYLTEVEVRRGETTVVNVNLRPQP